MISSMARLVQTSDMMPPIRLLFVPWCLVTLCAASCAGGSAPADGAGGATAALERLSAAEALWNGRADQCRTYHYSRYYRGYFGPAGVADVSIAEGKPVGRRMWNVSYYSAREPRPWPSTPDWSEEPDDVGSHPAISPFGELYAHTVEQMFAECRQVLSGDPVKMTLVLDLDAAGIPIRCTQRPIGCLDDCESGIRLAGNPAVTCQPLNFCATAGCPESGPARHHGCDVTPCSDQPTCGSLPDDTSCGAGVCGQGACLNSADGGGHSPPADGSGADGAFSPDASNDAPGAR